jgi:hypothetical protein
MLEVRVVRVEGAGSVLLCRQGAEGTPLASLHGRYSAVALRRVADALEAHSPSPWGVGHDLVPGLARPEAAPGRDEQQGGAHVHVPRGG